MSSIFFEKVSLTWKDLSGLTVDEKAFLALVSQASTDLNILGRTLFYCRHKPVGNEDLDMAGAAQNIFFIRIWLGKLFEFSETCTKIAKGKQPSTDASVQDLCREIECQFKPLRNHQAFKSVCRLRNASAFHYGFAAARSSVQRVADNANCSLYLFDNPRNGHFPMGDEVMLAGWLEDVGKHLPSDEARKEHLQEVIFWGREASAWLERSRATTFQKLIFERLDCIPTSLSLEVPEDMIGGVYGARLPVFVAAAHP